MSAFGAEWMGNAQVRFDAAGTGSEISFEVYNDMWCDSNFDAPGAQVSSNCSVKWDTSLQLIAPYIGDKVVSMDKGIAWAATACGDSEYVMEVTNSTLVYDILYGRDLVDDMSITLNGCWARFTFERPAEHALDIRDASIANIYSGESAPITFNGGNSSITVSAVGDSVVTSDWIELWETDRDKSYVVSFKSTPQYPGKWGLLCQENTDGVSLSWIDGDWTPYAAGLASMEVGYPARAIYRSGVYDTHCAAADFEKLYWTQIERFEDGYDIDVRIRCGNNQDLSDGDWLEANPNNDGYFQVNGGSSLRLMSEKRYLQYEVLFSCGDRGHSGAHTNAPSSILRDVSVLWTPPMGLVDLEVDFGMGPDCGIVEATVDGKPLTKSLVIDMEVYKDGPRALQTARAQIEIKPLNTGK
jgi:hypothetical protein